MKQKDYVIEAMRRNGGYATFNQLNALVDFSTWGTKTPYATIRKIVQTHNEFFRIQPGLWALKEYEGEVLKKFEINNKNQTSLNSFTHSYFQGIIIEIGNIRKFETYVPPQDKNKFFLETRLADMATMSEIYNFSYPEIMRRARTVDAIWFNERNMPCAFYEVEHTTNIRNSLDKFYELQDFRADFYIVAAKERKKQFDDIIQASIYRPIKNYVTFVDYDALIKQYNHEHQIIEKVI